MEEARRGCHLHQRHFHQPRQIDSICPTLTYCLLTLYPSSRSVPLCVVFVFVFVFLSFSYAQSQTRKVFKFVCLKRWRYDDALPTPSASPQHSETSSVCSGSSSTAHSHPSVSGRPLGLFQFEYTDEKCHKDVWVTLETPYV